MKNTIRWFGIIAFVAIIGFSMVACGEEEKEDPPKTYIVSIEKIDAKSFTITLVRRNMAE